MTKTSVALPDKDSTLLNIIHNFIKDNNLIFNDIPVNELSKTKLRQYIGKRGIKVNSRIMKFPSKVIRIADLIALPMLGVELEIIEPINVSSDSNPNTNGEVLPSGDIGAADNFILEYFQQNLNCNSIIEVKSSDPKKGLCFVVALIQLKGFDFIKNSSFSYEITDYLKDIFVRSNIAKELQFEKRQQNFSGEIVNGLIRAKHEKESEIKSAIQELKDGLHNQNLYRFLQSYSKIIATSSFQFLIAPLLQTTIMSRAAIENLIKPINEAYSEHENELRYLHFETCRNIYEDYISNFDQTSEYTKEMFSDIGNYLYNLFKVVCDATVEKSAKLTVTPTSKKYNFNNETRSNQDLFIIIRNSGEGLARNIKISSLLSSFEFKDMSIGLLKSEETREITIQANVRSHANKSPIIKILLQWEESSGKKEEQEIEVRFELQDTHVPWDQLNKQNPYSIQIIEDKSKLFGRDEIIEELENNVLSNNIESYKIWGQKRVGKSSIVKTLKSMFVETEDILIIYRSILGLRNPDPIKTLNDLGESICSEIINEIENKVKAPHLRDQIKTIPIPSFDGSFYPLEKFLTRLYNVNDKFRFVFIIDEFDRINEEFFKASDLGEGFSGSIGKALNERKYIGFILVGSENMQILDRQGMNYNAYHEREVDTFHKATQYDSYKNIIHGPVKPYITYTDEAIDKVFEVTNGNPFFTNLICNQAFKIAYKSQDSFIDIHLIDEAIERIINSSQRAHFEHFWGDGLTEENDAKKEKTTDIRRRVLVSFSLSTKSDIFPSKSDIAKNFKYPEEYKIEKFEVEYVITEFFNRKIFQEFNSGIRIKPLLFERWLCGPGKSLMIEGVADLEALHRQIELEYQFSLKDDELKKLSESLEYRGKSISVERYKDYFKQFGSSIEQRKIFKLLDSIFYISKDEVNEFFRKEQKSIFIKKEIVLKSNERTYHREGVEVYCFSKSIAENQQMVESFKVMSHIRTQKTAKNLKTDKDIWKKNDAKEIVIIEPVIDETESILNELLEFISDEIKTNDISVRLVTLLITSKAKTNIIKATSTISNFKLVLHKEVEETKIKPFVPGTEVFENADEANQAFAEVRKKFPTVNRNCLLILFSSLCPSNSCPVLWCNFNQFQPIFLNEHGVLEEPKLVINEAEERRTRVYHANVEFSQKINSYIVEFLKDRAKNDGKDSCLRVEYVPSSVLESIHAKWLAEKQEAPQESYFDFSDYKKIITHNGNGALVSVFTSPSEGLAWFDKLNKLRRDPAHPEKPAPMEDEVKYFEKIKNQILPKMN